MDEKQNQEVQQKIDRLARPKGFSCRPVLIHVNGVTEDVVDAGYFAKIIDFGGYFGGLISSDQK